MKNKTKNNKINSSIILLSLLFLNGCLSSNSFKYNSRESLVIGKTTQAELFQIVGKPNETQTQKIGSKTFSNLSYTHIKQAGGGFTPPMRTLNLEVADGVLNGFNGLSTYKGEEVDVAKLGYDKIIEHKTKIDDVISDFGFPSGQVITPSTYGFAENVAPGNLVFTWQQWRNGEIKGAIYLVVNPSTKTIISKKMIIK